jgi:hypothetical protein
MNSFQTSPRKLMKKLRMASVQSFFGVGKGESGVAYQNANQRGGRDNNANMPKPISTNKLD